MRNYCYPHHFRSKYRKYTSLVFSGTFFLVVVATALLDFQDLLDDVISGLLIIGGAFTLVVYDLYTINMYPNLTTTEEGLGVEFLSSYVHISWKDVESIHMTQSNYYPEEFTEWFVRTKKLTPFHLLYGKAKYRDYVTGFVVRSEIENIQQLLDEIGGRLPVDKYHSFYKTKHSA